MPDARTHAAAAALFLRLAPLPDDAREDALRAEPDAAVRDDARALLRGHDATPGPLDDPLSVRDSARAVYRPGT